jgi:hypothetical protein
MARATTSPQVDTAEDNIDKAEELVEEAEDELEDIETKNANKGTGKGKASGKN